MRFRHNVNKVSFKAETQSQHRSLLIITFAKSEVWHTTKIFSHCENDEKKR